MHKNKIQELHQENDTLKLNNSQLKNIFATTENSIQNLENTVKNRENNLLSEVEIVSLLQKTVFFCLKNTFYEITARFVHKGKQL